MNKLVSYLKEYARITLASIKTPRKFFEEIKREDKNYSKPFAYMLISNTVFIAGSSLGLSYLAYRHGNFNLLDLIPEKFVPFYRILAVLFFVYIALMQLAIKLVRGKGSLDKTFMVICYSFSPINFASWLFFLAFTENIYASSSLMELPFWLGLLASILYIFYIVVVGISVTSEISGSRAFAAFLMQFFMFAGIIVLILFGYYLYPTNVIPTTPSNPDAEIRYEVSIWTHENATMYLPVPLDLPNYTVSELVSMIKVDKDASTQFSYDVIDTIHGKALRINTTGSAVLHARADYEYIKKLPNVLPSVPVYPSVLVQNEPVFFDFSMPVNQTDKLNYDRWIYLDNDDLSIDVKVYQYLYIIYDPGAENWFSLQNNSHEGFFSLKPGWQIIKFQHPIVIRNS